MRRVTVELHPGRRDEQGRRLCCHCATPIPKGRRDWCGDECAQRYLIASGDQNAARRWLFRTQGGACQVCRAEGGPWEADHAIPLAEGGARTPENLRTLCRPCHRTETAALRKRLAAARRIGT